MKITTAFLFIIVMAVLQFVEQGMATPGVRATAGNQASHNCVQTGKDDSCTQVGPGSQALLARSGSMERDAMERFSLAKINAGMNNAGKIARRLKAEKRCKRRQSLIYGGASYRTRCRRNPRCAAKLRRREACRGNSRCLLKLCLESS